jgi:hypothetical protein
MTTATFTQPAGSLRHYLTDVSNAARAFAAALFAAQGEGRRQIFALAKQYEAMSPNLAAELRFIAAKD